MPSSGPPGVDIASGDRGSSGTANRLRELDLAGLALKLLRIALFYVALFAIWWLVVKLEVWSPYVLPGPAKVLHSLQHYWDNGLLLKAIEASVQRLLIGFGISIVLGMIIGMACGANKYIDDTVGSLVLGMQSLPSVTWLPLALIWFGLNDKAIIFVVTMGSIFAVAISARAGFKAMPPLYKRAGQTMGANNLQMLRYVTLPAMMPGLAQGLKLGFSFAWRSLMAAELLFGGTRGLGGLEDIGRGFNDMSLVIAVMLVIIAIGLLTDRLLFSRLEAWVQERWGLQAA
jgi:NitT/TauT family transport system permease protein